MNHLAMAVVIKNNLVLVQKRFRKNTGMIFEFPGGSIDAGDSGEQAAIRELWEETG
ncbi:NUDIX hydrolase, partial [Vibrio cholerae]